MSGQPAGPIGAAAEIIVIDDGSEDGTAALLAGYGERIRHVRKENGGKPSAVNLGLSMARGDLIWIFDDDDVALPDAIETRLACLNNTRERGLSSAHIIMEVTGRTVTSSAVDSIKCRILLMTRFSLN